LENGFKKKKGKKGKEGGEWVVEKEASGVVY